MRSRHGRRRYALTGAFLTFAVSVLCAHDVRAVGLGASRATAIEVCGPNGEHGYFDRLLCSDGGLVKYELIGTEGRRNDPTSKDDQQAAGVQMMTSAPIPSGQRDFHRVERYTVDCSGGTTFLYVDRYHCPDPTDQRPPSGFSFMKLEPSGSAEAEHGQQGLGLAKATAIEVCGPKGASDYLERLRCPDGSVVRFRRTGNMGLRNDPTSSAEDEAVRQQQMTAGPVPREQRDFHLIDGYSAECHTQTRFLYLDLYHCPDPKNQSPPPGYSLANRGAVR